MSDFTVSRVPLSKLKMGDAFQFDRGGPVYIKCRGGFRLGQGGPLHSCAPAQPVYFYALTGSKP